MSVRAFGRGEAYYEARAELAAAVSAPVAPEQRTLAVQLLARTFVDSFSAAPGGRDASHLVAWLDRMCDTFVDQPGVTSFVENACTSLEGFMARNGAPERERRALRELEPRVLAVARKARRGLPAAPEHLGETDARINELLARLDRADPLTAEHSRAVSAWSARIARRLTLPEAGVAFAARCGMIHDIGKITTPADILNAPRKLTPQEWAIMRQHTTSGHEIVTSEAPALREFAPAIRSHHERLDGTGYPDCLAREHIPLATRIVSVADSFNAMIGRRPYRPALPVGFALDELRRNSGVQFDPDVVAAMHAVVNSR